MTENLTPQDDIQKADQLDRLISARQGVHQSPPGVATAETALVDSLIQLAATTVPDPAFVAALEEQLQNRARPEAQHNPVAWQFMARRLAVAAMIILGLLIGCLTTPSPARATLWDWLYGFGLLREEQVVDQSLPIEQPSMPTTAPTGLTLAAIQEQAPFTVSPPTRLPAGLFFTGGFIMPTEKGTVVTLAYHITEMPDGGHAPSAPLLFVAISDGEIPNRPLLADGHQQSVQIGQQVGIYTQGNWSGVPAHTEDSQTGPLVWDDTVDAAWLIWQKDDVNYLLYAQGLALTVEDMVLIAESMA